MVSGSLIFVFTYFKKHPIPKLHYVQHKKPQSYFSDSAKFKNIQIFLIKSSTTNNSKLYVTLEDALDKKLIKVKETEIVNTVQVDNLSEKYIYINAGDIVAGGKQDRAIANDVIVAPQSKNMLVDCFCVEQDRWHFRGNARYQDFTRSKQSLSTVKMKLNAKYENNQEKVWSEVGSYKESLENNKTIACLSAPAPPPPSSCDAELFDIESDESTSSLNTTLEKSSHQQHINTYYTNLMNQLNCVDSANGIAIFVNGKLISIDVFNNKKLFYSLMKKLIISGITEAIVSENQLESQFISYDSIPNINNTHILSNVRNLNRFTQVSCAKTKSDFVVFSTLDRSNNLWLHKNWLTLKDYKPEFQEPAPNFPYSSDSTSVSVELPKPPPPPPPFCGEKE